MYNITMAYTKTKKNYIKSKYGSKKSYTSSVAIKAMKMVKAYQPELKCHDYPLTSSSMTITGSSFNISQVGSGDGQTQRDGNQISVKSIQVKGTINFNSNAVDGHAQLFIIQDLQQISDNGPSFWDVFDINKGDLSFLDRLTFGRFKILYKKNIGQDANRIHLIDSYVKCNIPIRFNGTGSLDYQKNGLYLMIVSNRSTFVPTLNWAARIRYTDN